MFRKAISAGTAVLFLLQTFLQAVISTSPARAEAVADRLERRASHNNSMSFGDKVAVLGERDRRMSLGGLDVFLTDDYRDQSPVLVRAVCLGRNETPSLAVDARAYGVNATLLNLTRLPGHDCSSYQVSAVPLRLAEAGGGVLAGLTNPVQGIAISVHYSGPIPADAQTKEPTIFVFNPVHGNWTEAKTFSPASQDPQRAYATLSEQHQRVIGGVIVLPESMQSEPARSGSSSLAKPLEEVNPASGYLSVDRVEPDNKGAHAFNLPMLLRPSRGPGPSFSIRYSSQGAPGVLGRGWDLVFSTIEVRGPAPVYHPAYETEDYVLDGMDLIALDANGKDIPPLFKGGPILRRVGDLRFFRLRNNSGGLIVRRYGKGPGSYFWEVWDPNSHVTKLYGGKVVADARPEFDEGNGVLLGSVPFSDGVRRAAIGQWALTQEYDRQPARNGAKYSYVQADPKERACEQFTGSECAAALRLNEITYNLAFGKARISDAGVTRIKFEWKPRAPERINSDGRLGFFRAYEHWLTRIDVFYRPDPNNIWLSAASIKDGDIDIKPETGWAFFAQHRFVPGGENDACMNFDRVLKAYEVEPNSFYDGARGPVKIGDEEEIPLATQRFDFSYEGEKFQTQSTQDNKLTDTCRAVWPDPQTITQLGDWKKVDGNLAFPGDLISSLGFGLLGERSLLGTGRTEETGASLYVGFGVGNVSSKELSGGVKGGMHFSKSEGNSTLIDITGDGIDDIVYRGGDGKLHYCPGQRERDLVTGVHRVTYPEKDRESQDRCGLIEGISDLPVSSNLTSSIGVEGYGPATLFGGVALNNSTNDSYVYFVDRDGDGLVDLVAYGQVFYNQGETRESGKYIVRFARHSALTPPIPGKIADKILLNRFPSDMRDVIQTIEARLDATSRRLQALEYSQTMIVWEAPLTGRITLAGEFRRGTSKPEPDPNNAGALGTKFGPKEFEELYKDVLPYQAYIDRKARCEIWEGDEHCHGLYSDPLGPHYEYRPAKIEFIKTPSPLLQIWIYDRGARSVSSCAQATLGGVSFDLSSLSFAVACRPNNAPAQQIDVKAGDVIYLAYSVHPHLSAWLRPSAKIAYTEVKDDAAFNLFKAGDPQKVAELLKCRWMDQIAAGDTPECLLSKQTRYEFDLRTGTIASTPAATVQLPAGTARVFGGRFEIPGELTKDYQVYFDVHAEQRPEPAPPPTGITPPASPATPPASLLRRLFRQDVSALCRTTTGVCTVDIAPACDPTRQADCEVFFSDPNVPYALTSRVTVLHKLSGATLPVRNISARLSDLTWRVPPHVGSIFTEKPDPNAVPGIVFTPTTPQDKTMVLYLPVSMSEPDLEYVRVEQGTFANPDTGLDDGDPEPAQIDFADILGAEYDNVALARIRQTLALCSFRTEILDFLQALFSSYGSPFADDYLNYWQSKIAPYNARCVAAETRFKNKSFTKLRDGTEAEPSYREPNTLRLPFFLRDLPYGEQITSAETLLERVLANLALGEELLTDAPRLTRRGYRLPLKVNPLDCKILADGIPLTQPIVGKGGGDCAYRLSLNFAMQEFEEVISDAVAENLREVLARFQASRKPAFEIHLTATINGLPIGFRELSGEGTGNDPCDAPTAPNTCLGQYGTRETKQEPIDLHFYPKRNGDVLQRITVNKRTGRATAFSNNTMRKGGPTVCHRNFSDFQNLGEMEGKQDCRLEDAQKYTGQETYEVRPFIIAENNQFLGRNRVLEFKANPLDVLELHIRLAGVDQSIDRQPNVPNDQITGKFSVFDGASAPPVGINRDRYLIPRSPAQILSRSERRNDSSVKQLACPQVPNPPVFDRAALPPSCRPWTRLGWTEILLGAQYRTYSDAQRVGDTADRFSILRRREVLRLHPEIEVAADQFVIDHEDSRPQPILPTVGQVKGAFAFYTRGPNVTKTGGDWSLFAGKAKPDGTLREPIAFVAPSTLAAPTDRSLRYGQQIFPPAPPPSGDPVRDASTACSVEIKPPHSTPPNHGDCENHFDARAEDNLSLKGVTYFPLLHQFVGPVTKGAFDKALGDEPARPETSVCSAEAPRLIAGCWRGADDTVFMESAVSPFGGSGPPVYSVSALAGFERPPIAQFLFQFDSYKKIACIDPQSPSISCAGFGSRPADGSVKLPNRPIPPSTDRAIEVFAPVQSSRSSSVSVNAGVAYANTDYIHTIVDTIRQFRDVNGDGYPDSIANGVVALTSPVGLSRQDWWTYFRAADNLPDLSSELTAGSADQSTTSNSQGAGIGLTASTAALFLSNGTKTNRNTGSPDPNVDPGFNFSLERGQDEQFIELRDFNGDGLADKLTKNTSANVLTLQLNAGNSLRASNNVSTSMVAGVPFNTSHSQGFGVRLGFSWGAGSYAAGLGLAHRDAGSQAALIDFTGDGRPDIVLPVDKGVFKVFPNLGNGFGPAKIHTLKGWRHSPQANEESGTALSETTLLDAGFLFTYGIPLPYDFKIVFTPGVKWARNQTRELLQIRDLNGDGVPDVVAVSGGFLLSGALDPAGLKAEVHYNPEAKHHLLTGLTNPSGSKWVFQHGLFGNSGPEHGRAVWAVTGVARYDGYEPQRQTRPDLPPDGQDVLLTTYDYSQGYYDRAERQFYGFANRTSTVYGCGLGRPDDLGKPDCLTVLKDPAQLNWATLSPAGYRKLQVTAQTFANLDILTQGMELARTIAGAKSFADDPGAADPPLQAVSRTEFGYSIDDLQTVASPLDPQCEALKFDRLADSWNANSFKIDGSALPATADGTQFDRKQSVFGSNSICHSDVKGCAAQLRRNACEAGFVHGQRAFWAQQTGSVRQRFISLETFGGDVPASTFSTPADQPPPRLISAAAFDHDQWGQVLAFDSIGEADSQWNPSSESSVNAAIKYAPKQTLNVDGSGKPVGYPLLGLAQEIQIFREPWKDPNTPGVPLRVREAIYSGDNGKEKDRTAVNLTDICLYPGGSGFRFVPGMCSAFKENMRTALADGYSSMQTALRAAYENTDGLPKGESSFDAVMHHQIAEYDAFGNVMHTISPLSYNKEWIERRFDYAKDPFRRSATSTKLTRCVNDIPGAGADTPGLDPKNTPRCTFGQRDLPRAVLRKPITHASINRVDTHFGAVVETRDINGNKLLHDLDRWGRLSLLARFWGNAPRENATFQGRLKRAVAKDESRPVEDGNGNAINLKPETMLEVKSWHILAVADYERISAGLLRSNLRRIDVSDSYSGLLGKDQTIREAATFADGLGRPIQSLREADVCLGIADELIDAGKNKAPSADLASRCSGTASAIVTPSTVIDALGRDLQSFESYTIPPADPQFPEGKVRESTARRFIGLIPPSSKPFRPLVNTEYDGAGRPLRVQSRLADSNPQPADPVKGTAQYSYRVVPEQGARLARFEGLTLSPRCTASAVWSDARGLKHTVFEDQTTFYPSTSALPLGNPSAPGAYQRELDKTRGFCAPIASMVGNWVEAADDTKLGSQLARVSYAYDPLQQLTAVDYPLDGTERAGIAARFDLLGRTLELQEPNSGCTVYAYDGLNSLLREAGYRFANLGKPCDSASKVRNEKTYEYSAGRLVRMSYHSLEEQGGAADEGDTVRFYYDRPPYAMKFGQVLETLRFVPNDQANQRFVDVAGRKCDNCIGQATVISDRSGARSYSFNELGLARREVRSIVAPIAEIERGDGRSETYLPEIAFYEAENAYTAFGDPVQERFSEGAPMNPAKACVTAGVNTCLSRFTIGRKFAPDGAVAQLLFNGKPLISAAQDALGRPAVRWTANGIATGYRYDSEDLRLNQMSTLTGAQQPVQRNGYQYDAGGNIVAYANNSSMLEKYSSGFVFKYDAVNRLTGFAATVSKDEKKLTSEGAYTYDPGHRFKTRSLRIAGDPGQVFQRRWDYHYRSNPETGPLHAPRRVDFSIGESTRRTWFDHDDVGRMTRICTNNSDNEPRVCSVEKPENDRRPELLSNRAMTWDAEGRLTRVHGVLDSSVPQNAELMREDYIYDASGNRTLKIHRPPRTDNLPEGARESATIYMTPYYARPYDRRGSVQVSLGTLPAVSMRAPADPSEEPRATFLYSDLPVGSMTAAVTAFGEPIQANATLIARREYSPYGLELTVDEFAQTGRDDVAPMSVFHGKELDRLTRFSSFGARYYSRDLGIWLKPDPGLVNGFTDMSAAKFLDFRSSAEFLAITPKGGAFAPKNLASYSFGWSNPLSYVDADGRDAREVVMGAIAVDVATPEPTDLVPAKWFLYAAIIGGMLVLPHPRTDNLLPINVEHRNKPQDPLPEAKGGDHSILEPGGGYTTWEGDKFKQFRPSGRPHGSIPRPNIKETVENLSPSGKQFYGDRVRAPRPDEIRPPPPGKPANDNNPKGGQE
ncbi:hypothetical protein ABIF86_007174 [Bradyrhizobium japonicum]